MSSIRPTATLEMRDQFDGALGLAVPDAGCAIRGRRTWPVAGSVVARPAVRRRPRPANIARENPVLDVLSTPSAVQVIRIILHEVATSW